MDLPPTWLAMHWKNLLLIAIFTAQENSADNSGTIAITTPSRIPTKKSSKIGRSISTTTTTGNVTRANPTPPLITRAIMPLPDFFLGDTPLRRNSSMVGSKPTLVNKVLERRKSLPTQAGFMKAIIMEALLLPWILSEMAGPRGLYRKEISVSEPHSSMVMIRQVFYISPAFHPPGKSTGWKPWVPPTATTRTYRLIFS